MSPWVMSVIIFIAGLKDCAKVRLFEKRGRNGLYDDGE